MDRPPSPIGRRPRARRRRRQQSGDGGWTLETLVSELRDRVGDAEVAHPGRRIHEWLYLVIEAWVAERDDAWRRRSAGVGLPIAPEPACAPGCTHCCYQHVAVTGVEARVLAGMIAERWSTDEVEALRDRLDREAGRISPIASDPRALARLRRPCPLLDEESGRCRAYEARPVNCRRENSIDVEVCRRYREDPQATDSSLRLVRYDVIWGAVQVFLSRWAAEQNHLDPGSGVPMPLELALRSAIGPGTPPDSPPEADRPDQP